MSRGTIAIELCCSSLNITSKKVCLSSAHEGRNAELLKSRSCHVLLRLLPFFFFSSFPSLSF